MDAKELVMTMRRVCKSHDMCDSCEYMGNCILDPIRLSEKQYEATLDNVIKITEKINHVKTYADDFFEKFPNAEKASDGKPTTCRRKVYGHKYPDCDIGSNSICFKCWNEPLQSEIDLLKEYKK